MGGFLQLDDLLRGLTEEGQKVSSGFFTVDTRTALEKLSKFQLASPHQYCLRWLQAAVAGGARTFNWHSSPSQVSAEMEGFLLDPDQLGHLPTLLLEPQAGRAEQHLSAGLNAVLKTGAKCITLRSGNHQAVWKPGSFHIEFKEIGLHGTKIEMVRFAGFQDFWKSFRGDLDPEWAMLHHQGACTPLNMGIQGLPPDRVIPELMSLYEARPASERCFAAEDGSPGFRVPPFNRSKNYPRRCKIYVVRRPGPSKLFPVKDGVLLQARWLAGHTGQVVLADVSHLATDQTGLGLVEDEAYQLLIKQVSLDLL